MHDRFLSAHFGKIIDKGTDVIESYSFGAARAPAASKYIDWTGVPDHSFFRLNRYHQRGAKVNFCPPTESSYMKPPVAWTKVAMPLT